MALGLRRAPPSLPNPSFPRPSPPSIPEGLLFAYAETLVQTARHLAAGRSGGDAQLTRNESRRLVLLRQGYQAFSQRFPGIFAGKNQVSGVPLRYYSWQTLARHDHRHAKPSILEHTRQGALSYSGVGTRAELSSPREHPHNGSLQ
jgi:hypothetical protein